MTVALVQSKSGETSFPEASLGLLMVNVARIFDMLRNSESSARYTPTRAMMSETRVNAESIRYLPGHALRPNPNTNLYGSASGEGPRWRAGLNV